MMVMSSPNEETFKVAEFQFCSGKHHELCLVDRSLNSRGVERVDAQYETPIYYSTLIK